MPPAVIAGGIAAAGTIGGALLSSHSQNKAVDQANAAQQQATNAQLQLGQQALGLNQSIYNSNYNLLSPFVSRGNVAGDAINAFLGLPAAPKLTSPLETHPAVPTGTGGTGTGGGLPGATGYTGPSFAQIVAMNGDHIPGDMSSAMSNYLSYYQAHPNENPGIASLSQIAGLKGDGITGDEAAVTALYNGYQGAHPATNALAPAQHNQVVSQTPTNLAQQASQAIAAGANPTAVRQRLQQMGGF